MNNFLIPFNHQPASVDYGNTGRPYTCPAGKYARIVATLSSASANASYGSSNITNTSYGSGNGSACATTVSIWITSGDSVSCVESGTEASLNVNGNQVAVIDTVSQAVPAGGGGDSGNTGNTDSKAVFHVEEYNQLT